MNRPLIEQHRIAQFIVDPHEGLSIIRPSLIVAIDPITRCIIDVRLVSDAQGGDVDAGCVNPRPPREDEHG